MRISEQDWRADVPRPLSHCGDQPGRDARWRGVGRTRINTVILRNLQRKDEESRRVTAQ